MCTRVSGGAEIVPNVLQLAFYHVTGAGCSNHRARAARHRRFNVSLDGRLATAERGEPWWVARTGVYENRWIGARRSPESTARRHESHSHRPTGSLILKPSWGGGGREGAPL